MNEKAKTTNNGSFLKLFKTLTARVLSSLKIRGLRPRISKLDKTLLFVIQAPYTRKRFPAFSYCLMFSRESRTTSSLLETIQKRRKTFPCARRLRHYIANIDLEPLICADRRANSRSVYWQDTARYG